MENFNKHLKLENDLIALTERSIKDIDLIGHSKQDDVGIHYLLSLKFSLNFFVRRSRLITKIISDDKFDENEKGILRNFFRGFIEIIARMEYARKEKEEFVKNYLWEELKVSLLNIFLEIKNEGKIKDSLRPSFNFYNELKKICPNILEFEKIVKNYLELQTSLLKPNQDGKDFLKMDYEFAFPGIVNLINNYWVDQKPFQKIEAYRWYRILSSQIHVSLLYEGHEVKTINFQILIFLMKLHLRFLSSVMLEMGLETRNEVTRVIEEIKREEVNFVSDWKLKRSYYKYN